MGGGDGEADGDLGAVCRLVMDKSTGKPKGTAFVQFMEAQAAQKACAACARQREGRGEGVSLRGKALDIDPALVQDSARALAHSKDGRPAKGHDRRNLYLVRAASSCCSAGTRPARVGAWHRRHVWSGGSCGEPESPGMGEPVAQRQADVWRWEGAEGLVEEVRGVVCRRRRAGSSLGRRCGRSYLRRTRASGRGR